MKEALKTVFVALVGVPLAFVFYLIYVFVIDTYLTAVYAVLFIPLVLAVLYWLVVNLKDFVVSIFKENKEVDEKGFKKHF